MSSRRSLPLLLLLLLLAPPTGAEARTVPPPRMLVIEAATVITVSGEEHSPGMIVIEDGEITLVGQNLDVPRSARRIRARQEVVMPGLVIPDSSLGIAFTLRQGNFSSLSILDEIHADEFDPEPYLVAGFTAVGLIPNGAGFPGSAAVVRPNLRDGAFELLRDRAYLPVSMRSNGRDNRAITAAFSAARKAIEKEDAAREKWEKEQEEKRKKAEEEAKKSGGEKSEGAKKEGEEKKPDPVFEPPPIDPNLVPLVSILREEAGALPLLFRIGDAGNLLHLQRALEEHEALGKERHRNLHLSPSSRSEQRPMVAPVGEMEALVIATPEITTLPSTFTRINLPAELARAGARLVLTPSSSTRAEFLRFRSRVAELVRSGLPRATALEAMTLHPARFLGLDERLGTIEKGKSADLIFLDGDPFAAATRVTRTMIAGEWAWEGDAP